MIRERKPGR